jgi:hypothetical protein
MMGGSWYQRGLGEHITGGATTFESGCLVYALDDFAERARFLSPPTHLKIDVDGPELKVVRGAREILRRRSLKHVLIEMRSDGEARKIEAILDDSGFRRVSQAVSGFGNRIYSRDRTLRITTPDPRATIAQP